MSVDACRIHGALDGEGEEEGVALKPKVKINKTGQRAVMQEAASKIERVDREVRKEFLGEPVGVIVSASKVQFARIGVDMKGPKLKEYAVSVSEGKPFNIDLK